LKPIYIKQEINNLQFGLYQRCLEPDLFHIFKKLTIERRGYRANFWIIGSSHVVNIETEQAEVAEVITADEKVLPSTGQIELIRSFENRHCDFRVGSEFMYQTSFKIIQYPNEKPFPNNPELDNDKTLFHLKHSFPSPETTTTKPITIINVLKADENQLEIKTFHSFVEELTAVVTHSKIKVNSKHL
jgi:hypothetical protein|tara:strand:+ start:1101 stop:1661 length:561 start_codon:yes stop_codon:yes gene_type:complete